MQGSLTLHLHTLSYCLSIIIFICVFKNIISNICDNNDGEVPIDCIRYANILNSCVQCSSCQSTTVRICSKLNSIRAQKELNGYKLRHFVKCTINKLSKKTGDTCLVNIPKSVLRDQKSRSNQAAVAVGPTPVFLTVHLTDILCPISDQCQVFIYFA